MGVEPFLIASSLLGVVAQRLVRRVCDNCGEKIQLPEHEALERKTLLKLKQNNTVAYKGRGCNKCMRTGYRGRLAVFEVMRINEALRRAILDRNAASQIHRIAAEKGMVTMRRDGFEKSLDGRTGFEEVLRVTREEDWQDYADV